MPSNAEYCCKPSKSPNFYTPSNIGTSLLVKNLKRTFLSPFHSFDFPSRISAQLERVFFKKPTNLCRKNCNFGKVSYEHFDLYWRRRLGDFRARYTSEAKYSTDGLFFCISLQVAFSVDFPAHRLYVCAVALL